jgi:hypothetical protein
VYVLEAVVLLEPFVLLVRVELPYGSVAIRVPLIREISKVDVAVTVTVRSPELVVDPVMVPLALPEKVEVELVDVIVDVSPGDWVIGGEVTVSWAESVALPVMLVVFEMPGIVMETAVVNVPTSVKETTALVVAAGTSVTFEVVVPSFTLTWTTLAVTVASGARGKR